LSFCFQICAFEAHDSFGATVATDPYRKGPPLTFFIYMYYLHYFDSLERRQPLRAPCRETEFDLNE